METKFQSTFIPKGPLAPTSSAAPIRPSGRGHSFFGFLSFLIFIIAFIASVGVYAYERFLISHIARMNNDLETARANLEADAINQVTRLNSRIEAANQLVNKHTVISPIFDLLETSTVKNVRFTDFKFDTSPLTGALTMSLKGQARGYSALALQAELFNQSKFIKHPVFSNLSLDDKGNVIFSFEGELDPSIASYSNPARIQVANETMPSGVPSSTSTSTSTKPR